MLDIAKYYWKVFYLAFNKAWAICELISGILALLGGFIAWKHPQWGGVVNNLVWMIPLSVFLLLLVIRLLTAPYEIYKEQEKKIAVNTNPEAQKQQEKAKKLLAKDVAIKEGRMFFVGNVYWSKDANGKIEESPYCPRCFESDGNYVHLTVAHGGAAKCPECKTPLFIKGKP